MARIVIEWIKKRAAEARKQHKHAEWLAHKKRVVESHSPEFFNELAALIEKSVKAFNEEFIEPERKIQEMERGVGRFVIRRDGASAVRLDCRLDQAGHFIHYRVTRPAAVKSRIYQHDASLEFDLSGKNEILLKTSDQVPMSLQQISQLLLEPFFKF